MPDSQTRRLRVCHVDHTSQLGGAELSLRRYLDWPERKLDASLVLLEPGNRDKWDLPPDVRVIQPHEQLGLKRLPATIAFLRNSLEALQPDIVVCNSLTAARYLSLVPKKGRQYVQHLRQEAVPTGTPLPSTLYSSTLGLSRFDSFIANSQWTASTLPTWIRRRRPVAITHPVSGISGHSASPDLARQEAGSKDGLRLLTLSRLSPWKGLHIALEALRICLEEAPGSVAHLTIAGGNLFGEDSYARALAESVSAYELPVTFVGHVPDVGSLLGTHDLLLSPSTTPEPFGQVIVQGMHAGLAVIASASGGPSEVIRNGHTGLLVEPSSPPSLASAILELAADRPRLARIQAAARMDARSYVDEVTLPRFEQTIEALSRAGK